MSEDQKRQHRLPMVENLQAPEIFADEVSFFALGNGLVSLTLASVRWDNSTDPPQQKTVVVGRVKLPASSARNFASALHGFLDQNGMPASTLVERSRMQ